MKCSECGKETGLFDYLYNGFKCDKCSEKAELNKIKLETKKNKNSNKSDTLSKSETKEYYKGLRKELGKGFMLYVYLFISISLFLFGVGGYILWIGIFIIFELFNNKILRLDIPVNLKRRKILLNTLISLSVIGVIVSYLVSEPTDFIFTILGLAVLYIAPYAILFSFTNKFKNTALFLIISYILTIIITVIFLILSMLP